MNESKVLVAVLCAIALIDGAALAALLPVPPLVLIVLGAIAVGVAVRGVTALRDQGDVARVVRWIGPLVLVLTVAAYLTRR